MALIVGLYLLTAVVLSRETIFFACIPVAAQRRKLKKVTVVCNVTLGVLGALGLIACMVTGQIAPMVAMLFSCDSARPKRPGSGLARLT